MSKKNNVNPDHYKTAGRERPGEDIVHEVYKRWYAQSRPVAGEPARNFITGARDEQIIYALRIAAEVKAHRKGGGK
jgi:hypothetical protein